MTRDFDLQSLRVRLTASDAALGERASAVLEHLGARPRPTAADPDIELSWARGPLAEAKGEEVARHLDVRLLRQADGALQLVSENGTGLLAADGHRTHATLLEGAELPLHLFTYALVLQLRQLGWYTLHAGAVCDADGRGCLIVGASGAGKSTLTLSLLRQGWKLLSDDSVLIHQGADGLGAFALRRGVYLEPEPARRHFPGLAGRWAEVSLVEATKHGLDPREIAGQADQCLPRVVLFPEIADADRSELVPLGAAQTLFGLVEQSRLPELDPEGAGGHMQVLGSLVASATGYRLRAGRDVLTHPRAVSTLIQEALDG